MSITGIDTTATPVPGAPTDAGTGQVTRTRVDWAPVPRVNLLPPEILDSRRFARTQRLLGTAVAGTLVLSCAAVAWSQVGVTNAREELEAVQVQTSALQAQEARYADVPALLAQVASARAARERAMSRDVLWYRFLNDLARTTPPAVVLTSLKMTMNGSGPGAAPAAAGTAGAGTAGAGAATSEPDPLVTPGIGQITFSGRAERFPAVSQWLESVATLSGLDGSTLRTATQEPDTAAARGAVNWTSVIQVAPAALSHRFDRKAT